MHSNLWSAADGVEFYDPMTVLVLGPALDVWRIAKEYPWSRPSTHTGESISSLSWSNLCQKRRGRHAGPMAACLPMPPQKSYTISATNNTFPFLGNSISGFAIKLLRFRCKRRELQVYRSHKMQFLSKNETTQEISFKKRNTSSAHCKRRHTKTWRARISCKTAWLSTVRHASTLCPAWDRVPPKISTRRLRPIHWSADMCRCIPWSLER